MNKIPEKSKPKVLNIYKRVVYQQLRGERKDENRHQNNINTAFQSRTLDET